ncbi:MAG TPA: efflux RND transporter periplasmic adaptor subunit [Candidatus Binataceae bacterium]|nr:efflux RND transporter periplasmic adaptor subunit [Candidatus Binataceae bacterium]
MTSRFIAALFGCVLLAIAVAGCQGESASRAAPEPTPAGIPQLVQEDGHEYLLLKQSDVPGMNFAEVKDVALPGILETTGQVTFDDQRVSTIVSRVQGRIEDVRVSLWDSVRRGEPIVKLYSPDFMTAEAEYLQALRTSKVSQGSGIDGSADLAASMASAARRKLQLLGMEDSDIDKLIEPSPTIWMRAPISGTVVKNQALRGAAVNSGDVLYMLGTLDPIWITADLFEVDLARVHVGQELEAVTTAFPDETFTGAIARVSPNVDPTTHTLSIRCAVKNPGLKLKPQMLARIKVITSTGHALVVPQDALVFETDSYVAYVDVGNGRLDRRKVTIASWTERGSARVLSGLVAGDRVVVGETLQVNALWHQAHGEST